MSQPSSPHLGHVLAAYAEAYIVGRSVLFVGDVDSGVPQRLLQLGARSVNAYDADPTRARAAAQRSPRAVVVRPLPHTFEVRDGAFDAAIVPDMTVTADPDKLARELARLVTTEGLILAATANADATGDTTRAIPYESFYDMFAVCFGYVRVAAQIPWRGVALAELGQGDEEPAVSVDSQLSPEPPTPTHFVIAASHEAAELDTYALFQLPVEDDYDLETAAEVARLSGGIGALSGRDREEEGGERRVSIQAAASARAEVMGAMAAELAEARLRADVLDSQLSESRAQSTRLESYEQHLLEERKKNQAQAEAVALAAEKVTAAEDRVVAAESRLANAQKAAREDVAQAERAAQRDVAEAEKRATSRLAHLEEAIAKHAEEHAHELAQAEARLQERASVVAELEREIVRRERLVRELVSTLEANVAQAHVAPAEVIEPAQPARASQTVEPPPMVNHEPRPADAALEAKVHAMSLAIARYEGELYARDWRISELEQNLAIAESVAMLPADSVKAGAVVAGVGGANSGRITELEQEVDTLRRALSQEHEDKKRIESGQGVDELRAALAEKMALIEQMTQRMNQHGSVTDAR